MLFSLTSFFILHLKKRENAAFLRKTLVLRFVFVCMFVHECEHVFVRVCVCVWGGVLVCVRVCLSVY